MRHHKLKVDAFPWEGNFNGCYSVQRYFQKLSWFYDFWLLVFHIITSCSTLGVKVLTEICIYIYIYFKIHSVQIRIEFTIREEKIILMGIRCWGDFQMNFKFHVRNSSFYTHICSHLFVHLVLVSIKIVSSFKPAA